MPVAVGYHTKGGKTGEDMKDLLEGQIKTLQACKACLERIPSNELTVSFLEGICKSTCEECLASKEVCFACAERTNQATHQVSELATGAFEMESSVNGALFLFLPLTVKRATKRLWS